MISLSLRVEISATFSPAAESRGFVRAPTASTHGCARIASQSSFAVAGVSTGGLFRVSRKGAKTLYANLEVAIWIPLPLATPAPATRAKPRHFSAVQKKQPPTRPRQRARGKAALPDAPGRARKGALRVEPRRDARRKVAAARELCPLARLVHALRQEKIRFVFVGMSAAILQGVPGTTLDTDIWVEVPERE